MFKNYFYLLRCVSELNAKISGKTINEIYTQEKDKLSLNIGSNFQDPLHIIISTNPQTPYLILRDQHKAKKNTKNFFDKFLPDKIERIEIALGDRVIKLSLSHSVLYFIIRGAQTNVLLIQNDSVMDTFKRIDEKKSDAILEELSDFSFIAELEPVLTLFQNRSVNEIIDNYKFIGKEIVRESDNRNIDKKSGIIEITKEIFDSPITVFFDDKMGRPVFIPTTFINNSEFDTFDNYSSALNKYFVLLYSGSKEKLLKSRMLIQLEKDIEKLSNKLNNLKSRIDAGSNEQKYFEIGNLLLSNIYKLSKGMKNIDLTELDSDNSVQIKLDAKLSPKQNIDYYFEKSRSEKLNFATSKRLFDQSEIEYSRLLKIRDRLEKASDLDELSEIKKELKFKMENQNTGKEKDREFNFRHYLIEGKYHLYVGKDSKNNDLLTTKFAKQNDFWFHARSVSGSHAVLRVENTKEAVPKSVLKKAASIAAFHSKSKTSKLAPVAYTFKKFVVKKKGLDPGQVILLKENVLLVPPEIPKDCEYVED